jgi:hypothetical protein
VLGLLVALLMDWLELVGLMLLVAGLCVLRVPSRPEVV